MPQNQNRIEWAKRVVANEDYLPWADVQDAKKILGLPVGGLTREEQSAYDKAVGRLKGVPATD